MKTFGGCAPLLHHRLWRPKRDVSQNNCTNWQWLFWRKLYSAITVDHCWTLKGSVMQFSKETSVANGRRQGIILCTLYRKKPNPTARPGLQVSMEVASNTSQLEMLKAYLTNFI